MSKPEEVRPSRLGRGLSALLGYDEATVAAASALKTTPRSLPIVQLTPSPLQPRRYFDEEKLAELTSSVRENGVIQPIVVRAKPGKPGQYEIVAGERRWRAAQKAGIHEVPVVVRELTDGQVLEVALIENIQRAELNGIEEARGYKTLIEQFRYTQDQLAKVVGKSRSHVANALRLLTLPSSVRGHIEIGKLSAGHARALVGRLDAEVIAERIIAENLSVRAVEDLVKGGSVLAKQISKPAPERDPNTVGLENLLADNLGLKVQIRDKQGKGELRITYKTLEQLEDVCERLKRAVA